MKKKPRCKKVIDMIMAVLMIVCCLTGCAQQTKKDVIQSAESSTELFAMDTYMSLMAYGDQAENALKDAEAMIYDLEKQWSVTDTQSDIYHINHSDGQPVQISPDTEEILSFALKMCDQTDGALDITLYPVLTSWGFTTEDYHVPNEAELAEMMEHTGYDNVQVDNGQVLVPPAMQIDLGAVGKGYTADLIADKLAEYHVCSGLIDLGGNIKAIGRKPDGEKWRIGIQSPVSEGTLGVLQVENLSVVTSGGYERYFIGEDGKQYGHILDPKTGRPAESGVISATVMSEDSKLGDALSTALFVMGVENAKEYWLEHQDFQMILVTETGDIYLTEGLEDDFALDEGYETKKIHVLKKNESGGEK